MDVFNNSPFLFAPLVGRKGFPKHSLTMIVKGTFRLSPGAPAVIAEEQLFPTGDEPYFEDADGEVSLRYESDFAYYKPRADLLLVGKCHPPRPAASCRAKFRVGSHSKTVQVLGDRRWKLGLVGASKTEPVAFSEMPLCYENSFGGDGFKQNPVGKGIDKVEGEAGKNYIPLPNIENPDKAVSSRVSRPDPVGFGPTGRMWQPRFSLLGTYKGKWLKERWPWFPTDFDWGHFNSAPRDMQTEGYLRGDEELYFENLHPDEPKYHSALPGLTARCFLNKCVDDRGDDCRFSEVPMNLDTAWVDMDQETLVLVWRGVTEVSSEDYEEVRHAYVACEEVGTARQSTEFHQDAFEQLRRIDEGEMKEVSPNERPPKPVDPELAEIEAEADKDIKAAFAAAGIDPDNPPPPTEEEQAEEARIMEQLGIRPPEPPPSREQVVARFQAGETFGQEDLKGLDLSKLSLAGAGFVEALLPGVSFASSELAGADLSKANLAGADLREANLRGSRLDGADLAGADLSGADLTGAELGGAVFENARMRRAILNEVAAVDTDFTGADLSEAQMKDGDFSGAILISCSLDRANLSGSKLFEATARETSGTEADLSFTDLSDFRASDGCDFTKSVFREASGPGSMWEDALLNDTDFSYADLQGVNFKGASLRGANLTAANMRFGRLAKADLRGARVVTADLFQATLEKADLSDASLRGSNLYGAELLETVFKRTVLDGADLKMTKLD